MPSVIYDASKTPADILIDYSQHLRCEVESMRDEEIEEIIKRLELCADGNRGPKRHQHIDRLIEICRNELDDRDLVHCLVQAGLITGVSFVEEGTDE
nr:MAG TPA: hypothetical protein [Siphovirus LN-2020-2]